MTRGKGPLGSIVSYSTEERAGLSSELTSVTTPKYPVKENEVGTMSETCKTLRPARLSLHSVIPT
jgi:hypothetical protein